MNAYKKYLTIDDPNNLVLSGLPFTSGQRVKIIIISESDELTITEAEKTEKTIDSQEFLVRANQAYDALRNNPEA
jgi:antitoxin ParD1/3/4